MALDQIDLYNDASVAYGDGTESTGSGVGGKEPSPGFSTWQSYANPPTGFAECPRGCWADANDHLFFVYQADSSIWRFDVSASGVLSNGASQTRAAMGLAGNYWGANGCCWYDSTDDTVIILSYNSAGAGNTPILGKWSCTDWPFTGANALWLSPLQQNYGSFSAGQLTNWPVCHYTGTTGKLYLSSLAAGQVITVDAATGAVDGAWEHYIGYSAVSVFNLMGVTATGLPVGSNYNSIVGTHGDTYSMDNTNPALWVTDTKLMDGSGNAGFPYAPNYLRTPRDGYGGRWRPQPLDAYQLSILGLTGYCAWWSPNRSGVVGELMLSVLNPATGDYYDFPIAQDSIRRGIGNMNIEDQLKQFVEIDGYPWIVTFSAMTQDIETENPGGTAVQQIGLSLMPLGPVTVTYSYTAPQDQTPKGMGINIPIGSDNYLMSDHRSKHRFRMRVNGGGWTNWRCGTTELDNLDSVVGAKAAWSAWSAGNAIDVEHQMCAGWPYQWDESLRQNPGGGGDPAKVPLATADVAPPREIRPIFWVEVADVLIEHSIIGITAEASVSTIRATAEVC